MNANSIQLILVAIIIYLFIFCTIILFTLINGNHVRVYKQINILFPFPDTKYIYEFLIIFSRFTLTLWYGGTMYISSLYSYITYYNSSSANISQSIRDIFFYINK